MRKYFLLTLLLIIVAVITACGEKDSFDIYYKNVAGDELVKEIHKSDSLNGADSEEIIEYLVGELSSSPRTDGLINVLPEKCGLNSVSIKGSIVTIDLSDEYYENKGVDELLARVAIVNTLTQVSGVESVRILVGGKPLTSTTTGQVVGVLGKNDIIFGPQDTSVVDKEIVKIYFPDKNADYLVAEEREIEVQASLSIERLIISELASGPKSEGLARCLPSDTKVISAETKDGVCFVNLSGNFQENAQSGSSSAMMAVYSIVNSLTELDTINSVQILIDGKTGQEFGNMVLDEPLEKNETLIKE